MIRCDFALNEFREYLSNKKIVCFGAGLQGLRTCHILSNWGMLRNLQFFIDNNTSKQGTLYTYESKEFEILSVDEAVLRIQEDWMMILCNMHYLEVIEQLSKYDTLKNIPYISLVELAQNQLLVSDYDKVVKEFDAPVIPKKIHYCWFGGEMPEQFQRNIESWKRMCPDYEICLWNEDNYDINKNRYMKEAYQEKKWSFVSDYARLDIIYEHGGIYLDTDVEVLRNLDDLLYQECFGSFDSTFLMNSGSGFGAVPKYPVIKELKERYDVETFYREDGSINNILCMTYSYEVLKKRGVLLNDSLQKVGGMNIYPMIFQGTSYYTKILRKTEKTYFAHYGTMSWMNKVVRQMREKTSQEILVNKDNEDELIRY